MRLKGKSLRGGILLVFALALVMYPVIRQEQEALDRIEVRAGVEIHMWMIHRDPCGKVLMESHHAGVLTNIGKEFIEDQLFGTPNASEAVYISLSNDASSPSAAWIVIPNEISGDGADRAAGTDTDTGAGTVNVTKTFSITGSVSCQLAGLSFLASGNGLFCADTFSAISATSGDSIQITFMITIT